MILKNNDDHISWYHYHNDDLVTCQVGSCLCYFHIEKLLVMKLANRVLACALPFGKNPNSLKLCKLHYEKNTHIVHHIIVGQWPYLGG